jgi:hypothetical protein
MKTAHYGIYCYHHKPPEEQEMDDLEAKIKAGQDKFAGVVDVPLTPIPEEYTKPRPLPAEELAEEVAHLPSEEPTISEIAEQQARDALIRDSVDRYKIVRDALENCLMQAQHMRGDPGTAVEALRQIEMLAISALQQ